jgi:hypothetical protein
MMLNFRDYIDYSERYLHLTEAEVEKRRNANINWLLIPSVIMAWTAIESFVNNRLDDYGSLSGDKFELHERALLFEQRVRFINGGNSAGTFTLEGTEYRSLEDKILFMVAKFSSKKSHNIKQNTLWQRFQDFKKDRDSIIHPRINKDFDLDIEKVRNHIETSKEVIKLLSEHLWGKAISI